ncbi:MAG TPA: dienelactone hydrolase family protein [Polyangiaceae bacterium]
MTRAVLVAAVLSALPATSCKHADAAHASTQETTREQTVLGFKVLTIFANGADESSPLIIGLHGKGGSPERLGSRLWPDFPGRAEIALVQGPERAGFGFEWFDWPRQMSQEDLAAVVGAAEEKLWPAIAALAHGRKVIVTGFSQGAMMSYVLAARHPDAIALAVPISGVAPFKLFPSGHASRAPLYALHGTSDDTVPIFWARATVAAFKDDGAVAELHEYPGVGHTITSEMREDVWAHVESAFTAFTADAAAR